MSDQPINVFLLIGQSNMAGRGCIDKVEPLQHPNILMFRDSKWMPAQEPIHTDKPEIAGVGLAMTFALELLTQHPQAQIGLLPCAMGGTSLSEWDPQADLYKRAIATAQKAVVGDNVLKGILWHQGEGDSADESCATSYAARLGRMIAELRTELKAHAVPFVAGELGSFLSSMGRAPYFELVNQQLRSLEKDDPYYGCVSASELTDKGDLLHFGARSLREFGRRYARKHLSIVQANGLPDLLHFSKDPSGTDPSGTSPDSS